MKLLNVNEIRVVSGAGFANLAASVGIYTEEDFRVAVGVFVLAPISGAVAGLCASVACSVLYTPEVGAVVGVIAASGAAASVISYSLEPEYQHIY